MSLDKKNGKTMYILSYIKKYIEREFGIKDISKKNKTRDYVYARAIYYQIAKDETGLSTPIIGKSMNRDHATVVYSLNKIFPMLPIYDKKSYIIYERYNQMKPSKEESEMFSMIEFEELKSKYLDLKRDKNNIKRRLDRVIKVKEQNRLYSITDRFNNLDEKSKDLFLLRANSILNMIEA